MSTPTPPDPAYLDPARLGIPWVDSPLFEPQLAGLDAAPELVEMARSYRRDGYVLAEGWIEESLIDAILADSERFYDPRIEFDDLPPQVVRLLKQGLEQEHSCRVQDAWWVSKAVRELAAHPRILELLRFLYQRQPIPFQTLNFPVGSEQTAHADTIHFDSLPSSFLCGVWVALEDVGPDAGPVFYYPGSHRLPVVRLEHLGCWAETQAVAAGTNYDRFVEYFEAIAASGAYEERRLVVPKGTVLVWSANLLHGGSRIERPDASRHSQVTHYYFEGCAYYAPILSNASLGDYYLRNVWDIARQCHVPQVMAGVELGCPGDPEQLRRLQLP